jgi:hypothetical protein
MFFGGREGDKKRGRVINGKEKGERVKLKGKLK